MKQLLSMIGAVVLLAAPNNAKAQSTASRDGLTIPEFRQVLVDLGTYLDAHKGTNLASQFSALPDSALGEIYPAVSNARQLQTAVATLKEHDAAAAIRMSVPALRSSGAAMTAKAVIGTCPPNSIIDNAPGAACTPAYPDPNNSAWQNLVNPIITFGAFSPTDYPSVSSQSCGLTVESNLSQVVSALNGTVTVAAIACGALTVIGQPICDAAVAVVGVAGAVSQGLFADCQEQDGNVNAAETDAAFHNTVTIYNALGTDFTTLGTQVTNVNNQITGEFNTESTHLTNVNNQITGEFNAATTQLTNVNNQITGEFNAASTQLTNVNTQITAEFSTVGNQITQATGLLEAYLKQIMKLELTPDGQKVINPAILTCTGTNCPNVLAKCPAAGCSWNNAGPLP